MNATQIINAILESSEDDAANEERQEETGYWGEEGAGCLILAKDTGRFLISQRSDEVPEPGTWGTWGGAIDGEETPEETVRREVAEETGYDGELGLRKLYTYKDGDKFRYYNFLATVTEEFEPEPDSETADAKWVEFGDWPDPLH